MSFTWLRSQIVDVLELARDGHAEVYCSQHGEAGALCKMLAWLFSIAYSTFTSLISWCIFHLRFLLWKPTICMSFLGYGLYGHPIQFAVVSRGFASNMALSANSSLAFQVHQTNLPRRNFASSLQSQTAKWPGSSGASKILCRPILSLISNWT